jgi:hypothetical protein
MRNRLDATSNGAYQWVRGGQIDANHRSPEHESPLSRSIALAQFVIEALTGL